MKTSQYFERTLFHDMSPAANEYYQRSAPQLFEETRDKACIEARIQSAIDVEPYKKDKSNGQTWTKGQQKHKQQPSLDFNKFRSPSSCDKPKTTVVGAAYDSKEIRDGCFEIKAKATPKSMSGISGEEDNWSTYSSASSTALADTLDQPQGKTCPPVYPGPPKLDTVDIDTTKLQSFIESTMHDFRVFYLRQRHSYSRLQITKDLFEQLLKGCHVFPRFNEFLVGFGAKMSDPEVGPPPLEFRPLCETKSNSYRGFECSYILRYIELTNRPGREPWSLRQFAVYHRYKPRYENRCSTWILVGASQRTELRLDHYTRSVDKIADSNPFELHVIFLDTTIASWRPYLADLTEQVTYQSSKADGIIIDGDEADFVSIEVEDHQRIKQIEDDVADLILCLDSTADTLSNLMGMYEQFHDNSDQQQASHGKNPPSKSVYGSSKSNTDAVVFALMKKEREIMYTRKKAEALLAKVQNTRTLISSLLERQSGHNIDQQIAALHKLERQGQDDNAIMRQLAEKNSRDSSSMRILTIITMIYLPCTIVSNFYSTEFVSQKKLDSGSTTLEYSQNAWLFFAIAVPLTLVTILTWYLWVNFERLQSCVAQRHAIRAKDAGADV